MTDPISDFLTRIRNAYRANHKVVEIPASRMKKELTRVLFEKGYILSYKVVEGQPVGNIINLTGDQKSDPKEFKEQKYGRNFPEYPQDSI